jgi:hypothetical protein
MLWYYCGICLEELTTTTRNLPVWYQSEVSRRRLHSLHPLITRNPLRPSATRRANPEHVQPWQHASLFLAINKEARIRAALVTWSTWQGARASTAVPLRRQQLAVT